MNIKLIAIARGDGWGLLIKDEKLYVLRPPYLSKDLIEISEKELSNALYQYGFEECDASFSTLNELIQHLKSEYIEFNQQQKLSLPEPEELKRLLQYATDEMLNDYLHKAETEFIPQGKFDAAQTLALDLLELDKVRQNDQFHQRATNIIKACRERKEKSRELIVRATQLNHEFPLAEKRYTRRFIRDIKEYTFKQRQLLPVGC